MKSPHCSYLNNDDDLCRINMPDQPRKEKIVYNELMLIEDLRRELQKIVLPSKLFQGRLSDENLSEILGQVKSHITSIKANVKNIPNYKIAIDLLKNYKSNLRIQYGEKCKYAFIFIKNYRNINLLPRSTKFQVFKHHPNLKVDYFKNINTKQKAYWLGWLYAESWMSKQRSGVIFGVEINKKEELLIDRFAEKIGFNLDFKEYPKGKNSVKIRFLHKGFTDNLCKHRLIIGKNKSNGILLPKLCS